MYCKSDACFQGIKAVFKSLKMEADHPVQVYAPYMLLRSGSAWHFVHELKYIVFKFRAGNKHQKAKMA